MGEPGVLHQYTQPVPSYSWEHRPKDLRLPVSTSSGNHVTLETGQTSVVDPELNGTAIKERLMANRLPESCV
uniref:Uncharacterized protein n=1 Tax=Timema poppense TaxID=170557 RepID=A0A7R9GU64_TIMPO|nr:unnamed protein product [Timema poppensis]